MSLLDAFSDLRSGLISPEFVTMITPKLEGDHKAHADRLASSQMQSFNVFGVRCLTVPGVYQPAIPSSSVFMLRALAGAQRRWERVLEIGTGTGVIGLTMIDQSLCDRAVLTDINPDAVSCARINLGQMGEVAEQVEIIESDLFEGVRGHAQSGFDAVIFNLPFMHHGSNGADNIALTDLSGQLARRFFDDAGDFLSPSGEIWFCYSNLSDASILAEASRDWRLELMLSEFSPASGVWKFAYRGMRK